MQYLRTLSLVCLAAAVIFGAGMIGAERYGRKEKKNITERAAGLFVPCILFWGILYSLVFVPFTAPDEYAHFASAYRLSNQMMRQKAVDDEGMVLVREGDAAQLWTDLDEETYRDVYGRFFAMDPGRERIAYGHRTMDVAGHAYLPQAVGITLGRLLSLGQVLTIYLGRLCNLAFFALCAWLSIRLAPFGKMAFFGTAMLPMTLELVSSLSYDAFAIGLGMLYTAYTLGLAYDKPSVGRREVLTLGLLLALLAPCKMVYIPLAGLCFLIPKEKFGDKKTYRKAAAAVAACMVIGVLAINLDKILVYFQGTEDPVEWAGGVAGYSISVVLSHPLRAAGVIARSLIRQFPAYAGSMAGSSLGWLAYEVDETLILFLLVWTVFAALPVGTGKGEAAVMPVRHRLWSLTFCLASVAATLLIMLLSWTPLDSPVVTGVQGRYFLPILPLALLACRSRRLRFAGTATGLEGILAGGYHLANLLVIQGILGSIG
ncbi:MAG: DUF2142 domain-containing protein [Lachnospiraceae bacterium]|jgi:uncharacterized membrane protein|nr:DUF2142 domain-containing protein [Lachnospiraceae bacterium]